MYSEANDTTVCECTPDASLDDADKIRISYDIKAMKE
jgi:hypothetical protein